MAFDSTTQALVDQLTGLLGNIGTEWNDPDEVRKMTSVPPPPLEERFPVRSVVDRSVQSRDGDDIPVRVYSPEGENLPGMVFFHGGGWVMGDLEGHDDICRRLAVQIGCVVVSVDYRLAPEHPFPQAVHDAVDATEWVAANSEELGIDSTKLVVAGDSSGGNLAAVTAIIARDSRGPDLAMQLLIYPVTDGSMRTASYTENAEGYVLSSRLMAWYWDQYATGEDRSDVLASPIGHHDLSGLPPAHVVTADLDPLRDEGIAYAELLRAAGVEVSASNYPDAFHGFFGFGALMPVAVEAFDEAVRRVRATLCDVR